MRRNNFAAPFAVVRIVVIYLMVGGIWILFSGGLLGALVIDRHLASRFSLFKEWAYLALTALLLYLLIRRYAAHQLALGQEVRLSRETIEHASDEIIWTDEQGHIVYANPAATRILGYAPEELQNMSVHDLGAEFPPEMWPEHWRKLKQNGSLVFETVQRRKDGSLLDVEISSNFVRHGEREYTAAFVRDISERKRSQAALMAAESRFRELLETVHLVAIILDRECRLTFCNDYLLALTGWSREEIIGSNWFETFIPAEEREQVLAVNTANLAEQVIPHFENHILAKNGERHLIVWNNAIQRDADGAVIGTASIGVDVTEHRRLERERRQLEQQMLQTQKLESLGLMAGGIAHDFNNILSVVMGNTDLALQRLGNRGDLTGYLGSIRTAAGQAAELARQMLAYSGKGIFCVAPLDLSRLVEEMRQMLEASIPRKVVLKLNTRNPLPAIEADMLQLRQVITNLVINASEAIGDENGIVSIATGCLECDQDYLSDSFPPDSRLQAGQYVYLDVIDCGCGMDSTIIARIFDPFFTTKFIGRGLGMAAVLGIVRGHNGLLKVSSLPGEGTTFRVLFPVSSLPVETAPPCSRPIDTAGNRAGTLVLLVDDEPEILKSSGELLRELGFEVITAMDGLDAVKRLRKRTDVGLVLLDLTMPRMDGVQTLHALRDIAPDLPVIISSGYSINEVHRKFLPGEASGFLEKPYTLEQLRGVLFNAGMIG